MELIETFEKVAGKLPHAISARRPGDVPELYANTDKADELLNWKASRSLGDMVKDSWRWEQNYRGASLNKTSFNK